MSHSGSDGIWTRILWHETPCFCLSPAHSSSFRSRASPLEAFLDCPTVKSSCSSVFPGAQSWPLWKHLWHWAVSGSLLVVSHWNVLIWKAQSWLPPLSSSPDSTRSLCSPGTCACPRSPAGQLPTSKAFPCVLLRSDFQEGEAGRSEVTAQGSCSWGARWLDTLYTGQTQRLVIQKKRHALSTVRPVTVGTEHLAARY